MAPAKWRRSSSPSTNGPTYRISHHSPGIYRALGWTAQDVADQLDDLTTILGPPVMTALWLRHAAELAHTHTLSFYDAAWAAAAQQLAIPLVSADRLLLAAGLAQTPTDIATRLTLPTT